MSSQDPKGIPQPVIILVEPQLGENIGTAARAMANFALKELRLVKPRDGWPNEKAVSAASGADDIVNSAMIFDTVKEAVGDLNTVFAATARVRDMVKPVISFAGAAAEAAEKLNSGERVGVLFGRENSGLTNDEVAMADAIIMAPVNPAFASLNIAQAVLLYGYEWLKAGPSAKLGRETLFDGPGRPGLQLGASRPATKNELDGFLEQLEGELDASGFLNLVEKRPRMVRNIRNMFQRMAATEQEIRTLRGIVASITRVHKR
jgi:tRNA/rRNA methyltransferase